MGFDEHLGAGQEMAVVDTEELPRANDLAILKAIGGDGNAENFSFQGIRRKLGVHQQILSRALHRLQRDGYVERLEHAYRISQKGLSTIYSDGLRSGELVEAGDPNSIVLLRAFLPSDLDVESLVDSLSYKWFGKLRWLGSTRGQDSIILSWVTCEPGLRISLKITDDTLTIETNLRDSRSVSNATHSAFELFDHVTRALRNSRRAGESRITSAS